MYLTTMLYPLVLLAIVIAVFAWWIRILIEALKTPTQRWESAGQNQVVYVLLMVFLGLIGTALYAFIARPRLHSVKGASENVPSQAGSVRK